MSQHLKRLTIPTTWQVPKKQSKFITRPFPGQKRELSVPLNVVFRDILKMAKTSKEVKYLLANNYVFVNGVQRKDIKHTVALMDVLEIKGMNEAYRLLLTSKGKLFFKKITENEAKIVPQKVVGKTILKGKKVQLNFMNGTNIILEKDDFKVGDVAIIEMPEKKIREKVSLEKDSIAYFFGGAHIGTFGKISDITNKEIFIKKGKDEIKTAKEYAFVIGKDKPIITIDVE